MANQRDIARELGINQATVSLALRGDGSIPASTRRRVQESARRLGYRLNPEVAMLMSRIRAGRKLSGQGVMALLVDARSESDWHRTRSYRTFHAGATARAAELGFHLECFFLRAPGGTARELDRILQARGIRGVIITPPFRAASTVALGWERYACVGCGHAREPWLLDRVANDHAQNVVLAFEGLAARGFRRVGMSLPGETSRISELKWMAGYLEIQNRLPVGQRVPLFTGVSAGAFRIWFRRWCPDAVLGLTGYEERWIEAMRLQAPSDVALTCLVRQPGSSLAGIDEKNEVIGATAVEWVAARLMRNEYGIQPHPKLILIEGCWVDGATVPKKIEPESCARQCRLTVRP